MTESPFASPSVEEPPPSFVPTTRAQIPLGPRIAGGVLVINALISLIAAFAEAGQHVGLFSGLIDILIGASLLLGRSQFLVWAKVRVVLGMIFFGLLSLKGGDFYMLGFQLILSLGLIGLLFGDPGAARIGVSATSCAILMTLGAIGLLGGRIPILNAYVGQLEDVPDGRIVRDDYQLAVPSDWQLRKREAAVRDNPAVEVWLIQVESDSHVLVIPSRFGEDMTVDVDQFHQNVITNLRQTVTDFEVKRTQQTEGGLVIESRGKVEGIALDYIHRLYVNGGFGAQVMAFGPEGNLAEDTRQIVDSFAYGTP